MSSVPAHIWQTSHRSTCARHIHATFIWSCAAEEHRGVSAHFRRAGARGLSGGDGGDHAELPLEVER